MTGPPDPATLAARAGLSAPPEGGAELVAAPSLASVHAFAGLDAMAEAMETRDSYRRYGSASARLLEEAVAALEAVPGRPAPVARTTASGQAALLLAATLLVTPSRRRIVVMRPGYSGTEALLAGPLGNLGLRMTAVDLPPPGEGGHGDALRPALGDDVAAVVTEVITNPLMGVVDIPELSALTHAAGAALMVDSTLATPFLFQPFAHGADLVFHSLTKHLSGHSDVLGGVLLVAEDHEAAGWLDSASRILGVSLGPFDAWLALRGLRTAALRVERASANAAALATWLAACDDVEAVHYPGVRGGPDAERATRLLPRGRGPMLAFEVAGGRQAAASVVSRLGGIRLAPSLGDVATTASHPAVSSHRSLSREQRQALGIGDGLLRLSVGIEAISDLQRELAAALHGTM